MPIDHENPVDFLMMVLSSEAGKVNSEGFSQLEHGLQCAANAERDGASAALITAALLHDIGWTLRADFPNWAGNSEHGHEDIAAELLGRWFGPEVTERHLVATEAGYAEKLSAGSVATLERQGLPLTKDESTSFLARDHAEDALALRRWDEDAKTPGAATPDLDHFRPMIQACLKPRMSSNRYAS